MTAASTWSTDNNDASTFFRRHLPCFFFVFALLLSEVFEYILLICIGPKYVSIYPGIYGRIFFCRHLGLVIGFVTVIYVLSLCVSRRKCGSLASKRKPIQPRTTNSMWIRYRVFGSHAITVSDTFHRPADLQWCTFATIPSVESILAAVVATPNAIRSPNVKWTVKRDWANAR